MMRKNLCFLAACTIIVASCTETIQKNRIRKLIRETMYTQLDDFKSYEPIDYSDPDTLYTMLEHTPQFKQLYEETDTHLRLFEEARSNQSWMEAAIFFGIGRNKGNLSKYRDEMKKESSILDSLLRAREAFSESFVPEAAGMLVEHSFRANTPSGTRLFKYQFLFDPEYKIIKDFCNMEVEKLKDRY